MTIPFLPVTYTMRLPAGTLHTSEQVDSDRDRVTDLLRRRYVSTDLSPSRRTFICQQRQAAERPPPHRGSCSECIAGRVACEMREYAACGRYRRTKSCSWKMRSNSGGNGFCSHVTVRRRGRELQPKFF